MFGISFKGGLNIEEIGERKMMCPWLYSLIGKSQEQYRRPDSVSRAFHCISVPSGGQSHVVTMTVLTSVTKFQQNKTSRQRQAMMG